MSVNKDAHPKSDSDVHLFFWPVIQKIFLFLFVFVNRLEDWLKVGWKPVGSRLETGWKSVGDRLEAGWKLVEGRLKVGLRSV